MKICPICRTNTVEGAIYCHMCGVCLKNARAEMEEQMRTGRLPLYQHSFSASGTQKVIEVWCHDITAFPQHFDLLTISAYMYSYNIYSKSVIGALWNNLGLDVNALLENPRVDLRSFVGCWLSHSIPDSATGGRFRRIGCVELQGKDSEKGTILTGLKAYFNVLDLAANAGISLETIALPIIGTGVQKIRLDQMLLPLMNEVVSMMKRNDKVKKVLLIEKNWEKASKAAEALRQSYLFTYEIAKKENSRQDSEPLVFLSYTTHGDTYAAVLLRDALRARGIRCWYAPDDIRPGDYASQIVEAIRRCTHFICIVSKNTSTSFHVINELNLAFNRLSEGITILPFLLDDSELNDSFSYYLSHIQWNYGYPTPLELRITEFLDKAFPVT